MAMAATKQQSIMRALILVAAAGRSRGDEVGIPCSNRSQHCLMFKCRAPPPGCEYNTELVWNKHGECCPPHCDLRCSQEEHVDKWAGTPCSSMSRRCPIAKCGAPPPGCIYSKELEWNEHGECCAPMCRLQCPHDDSATLKVPSYLGLPRYERAGASCTAESVRSDCPMAKCKAAPRGCHYDFTELAINSERNCCPIMCNLKCPHSAATSNSSVNGVADGSHVDRSDKPTEPIDVIKQMVRRVIEHAADSHRKNDEGTTCSVPSDRCPMAECEQPSPGCHYNFTELAMNSERRCCPILCNLKCPESAADSPSKKDKSTACSIQFGDCPVASCMPAPLGCSYKLPGDLVYAPTSHRTSIGCCPKQCQLVCEEQQTFVLASFTTSGLLIAFLALLSSATACLIWHGVRRRWRSSVGGGGCEDEVQFAEFMSDDAA